MQKKCSKCNLKKEYDCFHKNKKSSDGFVSQCKECVKLRTQEYYRENKAKINMKSVEKYKENRDEIIEKSCKYYENNKEKIAKYKARYQVSNKENLAIKKSIYYGNNKDKCIESSKEWMINNRDKWLRIQSKSRFKNRDKINAHRHKRRVIASEGDLTGSQWKEIKLSNNYSCVHCGKREPNIKLTIDHIVPLSKGGLHTMSNVQPLCKSCNSKKGNRSNELMLFIHGIEIIEV